MGTDDIDEAAVVGVVDNTTSGALSNGTNVNIVAFDAGGKVMGGNYEGLANDVPAGAKVQFDSVSTADDVMSKIGKIEATRS
jgi:hypothetical protein